MKRLGLYSGRIYTEEDYREDRIHECCLQLSDRQANDETYISYQYEHLHRKCIDFHCNGCPESMKG